MYEAARKRKLKLTAKFYNQLRTALRETVWEQEKEIGAGGTAELRANLLVASLSGRMKSEAGTRKTVRVKTEAHLSDLLKVINELLDEVNKRSGKTPLVVVDGLDKVDISLARKIYHEGAANLLVQHCKAIYTVPLALYYSLSSGTSTSASTARSLCRT